MGARNILRCGAGLLLLTTVTAPAGAQPLAMADTSNSFGTLFEAVAPQQAPAEEQGDADALASRPQVVPYAGHERAGTVIIDTPNTALYLVLNGGKALRYGIGVGRDGFRWSGTQVITRKAEWPEWTPPPEMIARQPYLPRWMAGGPGNPLGARALYLGSTAYRIHGTNDPTTIGKRVSSGCIRLTNEDVSDLYSRVGVGTKVVVLPDTHRSLTTVDVSRREGAAQAATASDAIMPATAAVAHRRALGALY
jgi:lipoprotein-anchoring transpeptidase ErfK/SrfK